MEDSKLFRLFFATSSFDTFWIMDVHVEYGSSTLANVQRYVNLFYRYCCADHIFNLIISLPFTGQASAPT